MTGVGIVSLSGQLFKADMHGVITDELSGQIVKGKMTHSIDAAYGFVLSLELRTPSAITAFTDYLAPRMTLRYADGQVIDAPLGLYGIVPPKLSHEPRRSRGTFECRDLTWLLDRSTFADGYTVNAGVEVGAAVRTIILGGGFHADRIAIPNTGKTVPVKTVFEPGSTRLEVCNALLEGAAHYALWCNLDGIITTRPYIEDFNRVGVAAVYSKSGGAAVVPPVDEEPDLTRLCNIVVVRKVSPDQPTIYAKQINNDPASPTSIPNIGEYPRPPVDDAQLTDAAAALSKAKALLAQGSSYYRKLTVRTLPDPQLDAHQVVELQLTGAGGAAIASGRWWRQGCELGFTTKDAVMTHRLNRVEPYGVAA